MNQHFSNKTKLAGLLAILFFALLIPQPLAAQQSKTDAMIFGHVLDARAGEHLPFANIVLYKELADGKRTQVAGVATDETGHYYLHNVPEGEYLLTVSMVGYKKLERRVAARRGQSAEVNLDIEPNATRLEDVLVSASRYETDRRTSSTVVGMLTPAAMEDVGAVNLAEGLVFQPGLRVENTCQNCGVNSVRINGLDGKYSQVLIDGRPLFSSLAGVYGLEQVPASMIDRVEVIRGGGSSMFGANAIGGVINVITREPLHNTLDISHTVSNHSGKAWDNVTSLGATLVAPNRRAGAYVFGSHRVRQGYDHDGDGFTELGRLRASSLGFRSFYRVSERSKLSLEYHNTYEFRRGGDSIDLQPHLALVAEQAEHHIGGGSLSYDFVSSDSRAHFSLFSSLQHIDRATYYGTGRDLNAYGTSTDLTSVSGAQFNYAFDTLLFLPAQLVAGIEYSRNVLDDLQPAYHRELNQDIAIASAFVQNEWKTDALGLLVGVRADKHSLMERLVVSPRATLRYSLPSGLVFRANLSTGFRAPQAFDEDLHIMAVGGEVAIISLDPDLQPEYSASASASVGLTRTLGTCTLDLLLDGFYTRLDNVFILREHGSDAAGNLLMERTNGSGAFVAGANIEASASWPNSLALQAGLTAQRSRYLEPEQWSENPDIEPQRRMFRTPDLYGFLTASYNILPALKAALSATYTGPMLVQHMAGYIAVDREVETPSFFDLNLKFSYDFRLTAGTTLQLNGGMQNIFNAYQDDFDQGPDRDAGYIYGPNRPRTVFLGLKLSI